MPTDTTIAVRDRSLRLSRSADFDELSEAVAKVGFDLPVPKSGKGRDAMTRVVVDAVLCAKGRYDDDSRSGLTSVSFRRANWTARGAMLPSSCGYDTVVPAIKSLREAGMIRELQVGKAWGKDDKEPHDGIQTRYKPADGLRAVRLPTTSYRAPPTYLRDAKGAVTIPTVGRIITSNRIVRSASEAIASTEVEILSGHHHADGSVGFGEKGHVVFPDMTEMYRVFNGGLHLGGRLAGGYWMGAPGDDRKRWFTFDGIRAVEADYETLHPRLLRMILGVPLLKGDEYLIRGWEDHRKLVKLAYLILINALSYETALGAIAAAAQKQDDEQYGIERVKPEGARRIPVDDYYWHVAAELIDAIKRDRPEIARCLHSGMGLKLMNHDSNMAVAVLDQMTVRRGIACAPIHDSFMVAKPYIQTLVQVMDEVLARKENELRNGRVESRVKSLPRLGNLPYHSTNPLPVRPCLPPASPALPLSYLSTSSGGSGSDSDGSAVEAFLSHFGPSRPSIDLSCPAQRPFADPSLHLLPGDDAMPLRPADYGQPLVDHQVASYSYEEVHLEVPERDAPQTVPLPCPEAPSGGRTTGDTTDTEYPLQTSSSSPPVGRARRPSFLTRTQAEIDRETIARLAAAPLSAAGQRETMGPRRQGGTTR